MAILGRRVGAGCGAAAAAITRLVPELTLRSLGRRLAAAARARCRVRALVILAGVFSVPVCLAQPSAAAESAIKAAFLYKFSDYIQWPPQVLSDPHAPIVFGVLDADQVAANLRQVVAGHQVNGHPIVVRKLQPGDPLSDLQVLFVGEGAGDDTNGVLGKSVNLPVLTVTESGDWNGSDSIINFVVVGDKVRFDVSLKSATRSKLKISTRLLSVARHVITNS